MSAPTVIQRGGKRYVKVGKKRIKVPKSISERELIQWLVKHFKSNRRRSKPNGDTPIAAFKAPPVVVTQSSNSDAARVAAREAKEDLERAKREAKEELKQLKSDTKADLQLITNGVQQLMAGMPHQAPVQQLLPAGGQPPAHQPSHAAHGAAAPSPAQQPAHGAAAPSASGASSQKHTIQLSKQQADQILARERQNATKLAEAKQRLVVNAAAGKQNLQFIEDDVTKALKAQFPFPKLRVDSTRLGAPRNPSHEDLIDFFLEKVKTPNKVTKAEPGIRATVVAKYKDKLAELNKDDADATALIARLEAAIAAQAGNGRKKEDKPLSNTDIDEMMAKHPEYLGTIARDEIPLLKPGSKKRVCWIMNTDDRGLPGTHWVCFFIDVRKDGTHSVEYYDPLADPFSDLGVTADLKRLIKQIHPADQYLKFRESTIRDQHPDSANCGPFCIKFLKDRLKGDTFAKASGYDAKGEKNIEIWKRAQPQKLWISSQQGEGLRDIYERVRDGATKIITRIKDTIGGRKGPSPSVRGWLATHGDKNIKSIDVCKKPIYSMIEKIGNWLSAGRLRENMDKLGYESMMHLYMIIMLDDGSSWKIEKNHVLEIKASSDVGKQSMLAAAGGTVGEMIKKAEAKHGEMLWKYHLVNANCQKAVLWLLDSKVTSELRAFIEQDAAKSLEGMGLLEKAATVVTDLAARADVALNGAGMRINH